MSLGQQAVILIRIDAQAGGVVAVDDLAQYMAMPAAVVRRRIQELADQGYVLPLCDVRTALIIGAAAHAPLPGAGK